MLVHFGAKLGEAMNSFYAILKAARAELEQTTLDTDSTADAVALIIQVQELKKKVVAWEVQVKTFSAGQQMLQRNRFQFPSDWLDFGVIEGEWSAFMELLNKKNALLSTEIPLMQKKILGESRVVEDKIKQFCEDWNASKPLEGSLNFNAALENLKTYEVRMGKLKEEHVRIAKAREAMELPVATDDRLPPVEEEMKDLKGVWSELARVWGEVDTLRETPWNNVQPKKIRTVLDDVTNRLKELPNRMRQYSAFEHVQRAIKAYLKGNIILIDLKTEAMKERHWKALKTKLNTRWVLSDLTLGQIWESDLVKNDAIYREIITQAQGEAALEGYLKQVLFHAPLLLLYVSHFLA